MHIQAFVYCYCRLDTLFSSIFNVFHLVSVSSCSRIQMCHSVLMCSVGVTFILKEVLVMYDCLPGEQKVHECTHTRVCSKRTRAENKFEHLGSSMDFHSNSILTVHKHTHTNIHTHTHTLAIILALNCNSL